MLSDLQAIEIADYDYPLPDGRIAKFPLAQRDASKLLVYRQGEITESRFGRLAGHLPDDTLLVCNNTRVIHARLLFRKSTGTTIEIFCLEPYNMPVATAFEQRGTGSWVCLVGHNKRWKTDTLTRELTLDGRLITLSASRREKAGNGWIVDFCWDSDDTFASVIECAGLIPLPPYLHRDASDEDNRRYQTVYASEKGSVAAPTAGLHFTDAVFDSLRQAHIGCEFITLHVGAGTFKPVDSATIGGHEMHTEQVEIGRANIEHILQHFGKPIVAVGTTSVRTLESLYWFGLQLEHDASLERMCVEQWEPYVDETPAITPQQAYTNVLLWMQRRHIERLEGSTRLMIAPGYRYHIVDGLITNFHQPRSTLLLLVSALIGDEWRRCYRYALDRDFRFLSYGDSCLFLP